MALPGTITINSIVLDGVDGNNVKRSRQPETISASLVPGRSRYGTLQQPGVPSTNAPKYIWVVSGVLVPASVYTALEAMMDANNTFSYSFEDNLIETLLTGLPYTTTVRFVVPSGELMDGPIYTDKENATVQVPISFTAIEI